MEQLAEEVKKLRKQVEFQGRIIAVFVAVVIVTFVGPLVFKKDHHQYVVLTDVLEASQVRVTGRDGTTAVLTSDSLTFSALPSSDAAVAVSVGVDDRRQPNVGLFFGDEEAESPQASMMIHRDHQGTPGALFIDEDGRWIPWNKD